MDHEHEVVYGLYENFEDAASAIRHLTKDGYESAKITVIVNDEDGRLKQYTEGEAFTEDAVDAEEGAGFGAVVGGLTALAMSVIPGVGPVFAAGPLAAALLTGIGAAAGAATGAAVAGVVEFDIDKEDAAQYAKIIKEGGALLVVDAFGEWDDDRIETIMKTYNPVVVDDND